MSGKLNFGVGNVGRGVFTLLYMIVGWLIDVNFLVIFFIEGLHTCIYSGYIATLFSSEFSGSTAT